MDTAAEAARCRGQQQRWTFDDRCRVYIDGGSLQEDFSILYLDYNCLDEKVLYGMLIELGLWIGHS